MKINLQKLSKKNKIVVLIVLVLIIMLLLAFIKTRVKKDNNYSSFYDFKTVKEVFEFLESKYISEKRSSEDNFKRDVYGKIKLLPYEEDGTSNEKYYVNLISLTAKVLEYNNFRIIDKANNIEIKVWCNSNEQQVKTVTINGETDYFNKRDLKTLSNNYISEKNTEFNIQSVELKTLVNNEWLKRKFELSENSIECEGYKQYVNTGINVRNIKDKVYNIEFTTNYKNKVVNDITVGTSLENIINKLGEPTYGSLDIEFIGYKSEDIYVFFAKDKISVYQAIKTDEDSTEFSDIIDKFIEEKNINNLVNSLTDKWNDYDIYEAEDESVILQYSSRGIKIEYSKGDSKVIYLYKNFRGKITKDISMKDVVENATLPKYTEINLENNLLFSEAYNRYSWIFSVDEANYEYTEDKSEFGEVYVSKKYFASAYDHDFIAYAMESNMPNIEIDKEITDFIWIDDYTLIYSKENEGIYLYNLKDMTKKELFKGNGEFTLKSVENNILKYDDKELKF